MMEITEKWVGQCAGGKVFREARSLVKLGKVKGLKVSDAVYQAMVGSGEKPLRVVVKVLGPTHVRNLCPCAMSRRTGAMCEHAAAVLLSVAMEVTDDKTKEAGEELAGQVGNEKPMPDVVPLDVRLSPRFPNEGAGNVSLVRSNKSPDELLQSDYALALWLYKNTGQTGATMLSLPARDQCGFFQAIAGHSSVFSGKMQISVRFEELRHPVEMEPDPEFGGEMLWLRLAEDEPRLYRGRCRVVLIGDRLAHWYAEEGVLLMGKSAAGDCAGLSMESVVAGDWQHLETRNVLRELEDLSRGFVLPDGLGGIRVAEAEPEVVLKIAGSTRALQASLEAVYPGDVRVPLGQQDDRSGEKSGEKSDGRSHGFPVASLETENLWFVRNPDREMAALWKLMEHGFQPLDASGLFYLRGEDETVDFLTGGLHDLRKRWSVETEEKLVRVQERLGRIEPHVEIRGSGEDWLACDISWRLGDEVIGADVVRRMLQTGKRTMSRSSGSKAVISGVDAEVMEGFLLDVDPEQEGGSYVLGKEQSGYLGQLRSHYGGDSDGEMTEVVEVPPYPEHLQDVLRPYQQEGVNWLYCRAASSGAALLADDMGLGKTLQTLTFMRLWKDRDERPMLVVCPATLLGNWRDEAAQWVSDMNVLVMHGQQRKNYFEVLHAADIIITSYALLDRDAGVYRDLDISVMVLDEASAIRNPDTLAAKAARKMRAGVRLAITGTPVENSVRDLWSVFQYLMPGYLGGREDFRRRYELPCASEEVDAGARAAMRRLRWRTAPFMLRRTKSVVAKDLPPKIESVIWCDPSQSQKDHYTAIMRKGVEKVDALRKSIGKDSARMQVLTVLLRLRQCCCDLRLLGDGLDGKGIAEVSVKLNRLLELLDEARRGGHRVLVFSQFTSMLGLLRAALDDDGVGYCYLDGATRDRSAEVSRFQNADGPPVFLISLKAGGYGLTLTAADTVVLFDPWWNPAVEAQAADRIHRIGQTKPSTIYKLITRGTVEEKILRLQEKKKSVISAAMGEADDDRPMMTGLSEMEMLELLES